MNDISLATVLKLLKTVDAGLCPGVGVPVPGRMCAVAAVCYTLGIPHGDEPSCVGWAVRKAMISLNDSDWASNAARAKGLRKLTVAQLGSDQLDQDRFAELVALKVIQKLCPLLFAELAKLTQTDEDRKAMESSGRACAEATSLQEAVLILARARASASVRDSALDLALNRALDLYIARTFADGSALVLPTSLDLARAIGIAIALDKALTMLADICLEVLVEMESPGCQWLGLCENKTNENYSKNEIHSKRDENHSLHLPD